jgi:putative transposase
VKLSYIQPGKPMQNAFIESSNGSFRDECLILHWVGSLADAKDVNKGWTAGSKKRSGTRLHRRAADISSGVLHSR